MALPRNGGPTDVEGVMGKCWWLVAMWVVISLYYVLAAIGGSMLCALLSPFCGAMVLATAPVRKETTR